MAENTSSTSKEISQGNSSTDVIAAGAFFTGPWEDVSTFTSAIVLVDASENGIVYSEFSNDQINLLEFKSYTTAATIPETNTTAIGDYKYYRTRFKNTGASTLTYLTLVTTYDNGDVGIVDTTVVSSVLPDGAATSTLQSAGNDTLKSLETKSTASNAYLAAIEILLDLIEGNQTSGNSKSITYLTKDNGQTIAASSTQEGHQEIAIHEPLLPFGSVHVENLTPIFQTDAVYGINSGQIQPIQTSGSGIATGDNNIFEVNTGTTIYSQAVILGRKRLRYRAGQGVVGRFTALYTTPSAYSYAIAGFGTASDGIYFGYGNTNDLTDTSFGILYVRGGVRETKTLTVSTGATSASNCTITLNGTAFTVPLTSASNIQRTVYEISTFASYTGWDAYAATSTTVIFVRKSAGTTAGTQSFSAGTTGAAATIAQTKAGANSVDTFIKQSQWNGDKLDGTGASGVTLDKTKGNVFQIGIQYLGFGAITCKVETCLTGNNPIWTTVHIINIPNTLTSPSFTNPSFPFTMAAYSAGSTTAIGVKTASFGGFIEGQKMLQGNRFTYFNQLTTVGATNLQALFTIMNTRYYAGKANQAVINLLSVSGAIKHTSPVIYYLIKGGTLAGNPSFTQLASNSASVYDTAATTVTYTTGDQLLWTGHLGDTGELDHHFGNGSYNAEELTLQPGEWITLAAKATTGTPSFVTGSINTREDQ